MSFLVFNSPLPNAKLWNGPTIGFLQTQDTFTTGGWWHDSRILAATGDGLEKEEPRAWAGWWNEKIAELIQLSVEQKDALTVVLTGRSENAFAGLIKRMLLSKGLDPDMLILKPAVGPRNERFTSTMMFKQTFFECLIGTYRDAEEVRVYEDRIGHVKQFREFFMDYNKRLLHGNGLSPSRSTITAEVIQVADGATQLDPVIEISEVQRLINDHNANVSKAKRGTRYQIKKTVFYTGYLIDNADTQRLLTLAQIPSNMRDMDMKFLANNILITPRPCPISILEKVGGMGAKVTWEVVGTAIFENKIWAAHVQPVPSSAKIYTENPQPIIVLALRKFVRPMDAGKIQNWQPVPPEKQFRFGTTVGEKVLLRIEEEDLREDQYESLFPNKSNKRKHFQDEENRLASGSFGSSFGNCNISSPNSKAGGYQNHHTNAFGKSHTPTPRGGGNSFRGSNRGSGRGFRNTSNNSRHTPNTNTHTSRGSRNHGGGGGGGRHTPNTHPNNHPNTSFGANNSNNNNNSGNVGGPMGQDYDVTVAYEDFPPLQKQYQTPQQLVQKQFEQFREFQMRQAEMQKDGGNVSGVGEMQY